MVNLRLAAFFTVEHGHGRSPKPLARQTPIGPQTNHRTHTFLTAGGVKFNVRQIVHKFLAQAVFINGHKPLFRCAENNGVVATPTMRITVYDFLLFDKHAELVQLFDHERVGLKHVHAFKHARVFGIAPFFVHRADGFQLPLFAGLGVFFPVAGRNVYDSDPGVHGYKVRPNNRIFLMRKRMIVFHTDEFFARHFPGLGAIKSGVFQKFFR